MQKIAAIIFLVAYLAFLGGAFGKIQNSLQHHLCSSGQNDQPDTNSKSSCYHQALLHHLKVPAQTPSQYKYKFSPAVTTGKTIASVYASINTAYKVSAYSNPLIYHSIYLKNSVLII